MMILNAEDVVSRVLGMARGEFVRFISGQGDLIEVFVNEEDHLVFTIDDIVRLWAKDVYLYDGALKLISCAEFHFKSPFKYGSPD